MDGFVSQRPAAADDADISLLVNAAGHDADFAFAGRDDARAVRADEARLLEIDDGRDADHIEGGDTFGDADDKRELRIGGFENGVGGVRRRDKNDRGVCASGFGRVGDGVEDRALEMLGATFAGRDSDDDVGAVLDHLLRR